MEGENWESEIIHGKVNNREIIFDKMRTSTYHKKSIYRAMGLLEKHFFGQMKFKRLRYYFQKYEKALLKEKGRVICEVYYDAFTGERKKMSYNITRK